MGGPSLEYLRARAESHFEVVDLWKPRMVEGTEIDPYLAPMIYRGVQEGSESVAGFGALASSGEGRGSVDVTRPTVYWRRASIEVGGVERTQLAFLWFFPGASPGGQEVQGLRMTLDSRGFPAIFELLRDSSRANLFYVTRALETRVAKERGEPLAGRTFCVEPALKERPDVLVPRLIGEGPAPMGPFVYHDLEGHDLVSLHCRCSPSQIKTIRETMEYDLLPLEALPEGVPGFEDPEWPFDCLRLPASF
jgi:hypothetical protein